jgi:hypothetical protein
MKVIVSLVRHGLILPTREAPGEGGCWWWPPFSCGIAWDMSDRPGKRQKGVKMTPEVALQWVAYAARRPVEDIASLLSALPDGDLVRLGRLLEKSKLLNPPRHRPVKNLTFVCRCGCGQLVTRQYRTCKPLYKNDAHKQRYYRRKKKLLAEL